MSAGVVVIVVFAILCGTILLALRMMADAMKNDQEK